jgi:hypothetical protein
MTAADRRAAIAAEQERLQRFGLSSAFAARATSASPSGMWYPDQDELVSERIVTHVISPKPASPNDTPVANAPPPAARGDATPAASAALATAARSAPARGISSTGETAAAASAWGYEIDRTKLPADLLKRLSAAPRKAAVIPPAAAK